MIFHILVGQRKVDYPGQYAPEALEVMDDNAMGDNEEWMKEKFKFYRDSDEFDSLVIIKVGVPDQRIDDILFPPNHVKGCIL